MTELTHIRDVLIGQGGVVVMFIIALVSGYKQKWVWGREKTETLAALAVMTADRDRWQQRYLVDVDDVKAQLREQLKLRLQQAGPAGGATA